MSWKSPHEVLLGTSPSYQHLRVFGCLCYGRNAYISHKFDARSLPGIFIGYPLGQKGYIIYDLASKQIYVSRDVTFYETNFPFQGLSTNPPPLFPLPMLDSLENIEIPHNEPDTADGHQSNEGPSHSDLHNDIGWDSEPSQDAGDPLIAPTPAQHSIDGQLDLNYAHESSTTGQ